MFSFVRNCQSVSATAAAKSLQSCLTLCDPIDGSPPGSPSMGLFRQEHWSGLPFPSPMHESEKCKWSHSVVSDSSWPHGLQPIKLLCPWDFPGKCTGVDCHCPLHQLASLFLLSWHSPNFTSKYYILKGRSSSSPSTLPAGTTWRSTHLTG